MIRQFIHSLLRRLNNRLIDSKTYDERERHRITKLLEEHGMVKFHGKPRKNDTRLVFESFPQFEMRLTGEEITELKKQFIPMVWEQSDEFYRLLEKFLTDRNIFK